MVLLQLPAILFVLMTSGSVPLEQSVASPEGTQGLEQQDPWLAARNRVPEDQLPGWDFLLEHMPASDRASLDVELVLENVAFAYLAWHEAPWFEAVDEELFLNEILPYCNINERRDRWRADFYTRFQPLVKDAQSPGEAAAILNRLVFPQIGVIYSTERPKADQSPYESIDAGKASCTGLSVLLVDACRSVGVPARFVGTPLWADGSGNHSWVEVWDDGWHFTGAAEPTGDRLDEAWFTDRAAQARADDRERAIYAVSYRWTPMSLPMVWDPSADEVYAVNVTDRYTTADALPEGTVRLRLRARQSQVEAGADALPAKASRIAAAVEIQDAAGATLFRGTTRDERYDANDHLIAPLPLGQVVQVRAVVGDQAHTMHLVVPADGSLLDFTFGDALDTNLSTPEELLWQEHRQRILRSRAAEMEARVLRIGEWEMPFAYTVFGDNPEGGRSLFLSMHGGGGAPIEVNDQQWENQQRLYAPAEGVYLAPRAPTDTWNLWHQDHIDLFFDRLIENLIVFEDVNPDRVYLMGYSAGGDGVYQLAPRMADRWAAAAMMAGHPNDAKADSLHNLPFTLHMGAEDGAYDRNKVAIQWKGMLAGLAAGNPGAYRHEVMLHQGKGHWMDKEDAMAVPWMAAFDRDLRPAKVVWQQDDVVHARFYWLHNPDPQPRSRVVVRHEGNTFHVEEARDVAMLVLRMDESMVDFGQDVVVLQGGAELFRGKVSRDLDVLRRTLRERGDPLGMWSAEVQVELDSTTQGTSEERTEPQESAKVVLDGALQEVLTACVEARKQLDYTGEPKLVDARLLAERQRLEDMASELLLMRGVVAEGDPRTLASLASLLSMQALIAGKGGGRSRRGGVARWKLGRQSLGLPALAGTFGMVRKGIHGPDAPRPRRMECNRCSSSHGAMDEAAARRESCSLPPDRGMPDPRGSEVEGNLPALGTRTRCLAGAGEVRLRRQCLLRCRPRG